MKTYKINTNWLATIDGWCEPFLSNRIFEYCSEFEHDSTRVRVCKHLGYNDGKCNCLGNLENKRCVKFMNNFSDKQYLKNLIERLQKMVDEKAYEDPFMMAELESILELHKFNFETLESESVKNP